MTAIPQEPQNGNGQMAAPPGQTLQGGTLPEDPSLGINALLRAVRIAAENAAGDDRAAEAKDWAVAALNFAQAIVVLDPSLSQGGTPLQHDIALKSIEGETQARVADIQRQGMVQTEAVRGENQLRQAREAAAAPTPVKRLTINREDGRATGARVEG